MKTHVKLLVLAMVLVMFTLCLAACGGGGDTTTTTEAPATTTAATTTAAPVGAFEVEVTAENKYTGKEITPVYVAEKPVGTKTSIVYEKVDANGNVIATLPAGEKPVDCGNYKVTVTLDRLTEPQLTPDSYYSEYISQTFYFTLTQDHLNNIGKSFE